MAFFLDRVSAHSARLESLSEDARSWLSTLVDEINATIEQIQDDLNNAKINTTADIGGSGAGPISVTVDGLDANSPIVATIASSTNTVAVAKCIGTATGFDITFTADPGASCIVNYVVGQNEQT